MTKYIPVVVFIYIALVVVLFLGSLTYYFNDRNRESAYDVAETFMTSLAVVHRYYSKEIVTRAETAGVTLSAHYKHFRDRLPQPGTVAMDLGRELELEDPRLSFNLYSRHPFPWSADRQLDSFEQTSLDAFASGEMKPRSTIEEFEGQQIIRFAVPVIMQEACVACHNREEYGFDGVWKVGDLRGARQVSLPVHSSDILSDKFVFFVTFFTLVVGGLGMGIVWPLTRKLQHSYVEKSADLLKIQNTEEKLRQAQKLESVGQLSGGIAHDINNLLAVIQGNTELYILEKNVKSELLDAVLNATQGGASLIQKLLAFSRKQPLMAESIDIAQSVGNMSEVLMRTLGETIDVSFETQDDLWRAYADPNQVQIALLNLAINSRDAMPNGGRLSVECRNAVVDGTGATSSFDVAAGDYIVLSVSDNGLGMTREELANAVDPFFTTKEIGKGSGLGLSMVYGFAKQSKGHMEIISERHVGTTVELYFPRSQEEIAEISTTKFSGIPRGNGELILVIEDEPDVCEVARRMLTAINYKVLVAENADAARKLVATGAPIDLVLCDIILTGTLSGPEYIEEALSAGSDFAVVFMSGYLADEVKLHPLVISDNVLINKPFRIDQLAIALSDELARQRRS